MTNSTITYPVGESVWVQYLQDGKPLYIITSTKLRDVYFLYEVKCTSLVKTKYEDKDPTMLEKYMNKLRR